MALVAREYIKMLNDANAIEGLFLFEETGIPLVSIMKTNLLVDVERIGGLIAAVKDFASEDTGGSFQSINMKTKRILFQLINNFIIAIIFPKNEIDDEIQKILEAIVHLIEDVRAEPKEHESLVNLILAKFIYNVFNQELNSDFDLEFGDHLEQKDIQRIIEYVEDFKLKEASKEQAVNTTSTSVPEKQPNTSTSSSAPLVDHGDTISTSQSVMNENVPIKTQRSAVEALLSRFKSMFQEIKAVSLILPSPLTGLDFITISDFPETIDEKIKEIILNMWPEILPLLPKDSKERTLHIDDKYMFLYPVSFKDSSFIYVVLTSIKSISMIDLILERIVKTLHNLLPSDDIVL